MSMASKGDRRFLASRIPSGVYEILEHQRIDAGVGSMSQYIADLLANYTGRPDLILEADPKRLSREVPA